MIASPMPEVKPPRPPATPKFGAHLSVAGGLHLALDAGARVGCDCVQVFVKNQRRWNAPPLAAEDVACFHEARARTGLEPVVVHGSYLLNLASPDRRQRARSVAALRDELDRCHTIGIHYLVVHPGAYVDSTATTGIRRIARGLNAVLVDSANVFSMILLETTAGQGTAIGHRFEQLAAIFDLVRQPERLGVCLDTCHLFAAGYDFRGAEGYAAMIADLDRVLGVAKVKCIHVNDSKREAGSRVDRHEHIGKGKIGKAAFAHFVNDPRFGGLPFILETPKGTDGRGTDLDRVNLKKLRSLLGHS